MGLMMAFGWASIALCIGTLLRAKIPAFRKMLIPASVIGGILGMIFMNAMSAAGICVGVDSSMYTSIVNHLFTLSFISISLTRPPKHEDKRGKEVLRGALGMGIVWCLLYALTPLAGAGIIALVGSDAGMDRMYGTLIPFAFTQGPGQAAAFGALYESYGWENAGSVGVTFAAVGFLAAFLFGIPAAKSGIRRGLAKNCGNLSETVLRGYYKKEEQTTYMVRDTTVSSNIETLTYHFALIGLCYILAIGISKILGLLPGFLGNSMEGLMFMNGMYAAYIVRWLTKKLHIDFLQEDALQGKITGWTADYLVVCAFMAVGIATLGSWLGPMLIECVVITALTFAVCFYFGSRFGGKNDFERTLGLYGTATGTVPSGIALVRIVDPYLTTTTAVELGMMNLVMLLCTPVYLVLLAMASGSLRFEIGLVVMVAAIVVYLVLLKLTGTWRKKSYFWNGGNQADGDDIL